VLLSYCRAIYQDRINSFIVRDIGVDQIPKDKLEEYEKELEASSEEIMESNKPIKWNFDSLFNFFVHVNKKGFTNREILQFPVIWLNLLSKHITVENIEQVLDVFDVDFVSALNENSDYL
jgi:hypothetical protein